MGLTLAGITGHARKLYVDTDATDPALAEADLYSLINEVYLKWHEAVEPRWQTGGVFVVGGTATSALSNANTYAEIHTLTVGSLASTYRTIEMVDYQTIQDKLSEDGSTTSDVPQYACVRREGTDVEANMGLWTVHVWPRSALGYSINALYRKTPTILAAPTDEPDVTDEARYVIARIVAARAAAIVGEDPDFIAQIVQPIPEEVQSAMGLVQLQKRPRIAGDERG